MRTMQDFVKDMKLRGRTKEEVRCIALSTRWSSRLPEVLEHFDNLN